MQKVICYNTSTMADNNDILKAIESIKSDVVYIKNDLQDVKQSQAQTNTALEALAAGQEEIKKTMATKADVQDVSVKISKYQKLNEQRFENLEELTGATNPHKN